MNNPEIADLIFISVNSLKSLTESMETWFSGLAAWCFTSPNPALESENEGQKMGTSFSYAARTRQSRFFAFVVKYFPICVMNSLDEYVPPSRESAMASIVLSQT